VAGEIASVKTALNDLGGSLGLPLGDILLGDIGRFVKGYGFEVFDVRKLNEPLFIKALVLAPTRYTLSEPFAVTLTPTEDNTVVAEENGIIIRELTIEGTTGLQKRAEEGLGRAGKIGTNASGPEHFAQLREMFRAYSRLKKDPAKAPFIQMRFHNIKEDEHYVVVPRSFDTPRDAQTRVHFNYRITMAVIETLPKPTTPSGGLLGDIGAALKGITKSINDARAVFVELVNTIDVLKERIQNPSILLERTALALNGISDYVEANVLFILTGIAFHESVISFSELFREDAINNIDGEATFDQTVAARKVAALEAGLTAVTAHPEAFEPPLGGKTEQWFLGASAVSANDIANKTAGADVGTRTQLALGSARDGGLDLGSYAGGQEQSLSATDTIESLANANGVSRESIILLNRLRAPYISVAGGPGVKRPGEKILIPVRAATATPGLVPAAPYLTAEEALYGIDMALDPVLAAQGIFELLVDDQHGSLDVDKVRGIQNVVQGIRIILGTELGTTNFVPDLGIRRLPGIRGTLSRLVFASTAVRDAILSDARVDHIDSVRLVINGDVLSQEITPVLRGDRPGVTLAVPFGSVSG
jgi:hypothetical protein